MAFFSGFVGTIVFALCVGVGVAVAIFVPLTIYTTPFCLWLGFKQQSGKYRDVKLGKVTITIRNATRVYKSWVSKTPPVLIAPNKSWVRE